MISQGISAFVPFSGRVMAPPVGLEPTTTRLTAAGSTDCAKEECLRVFQLLVLALPIFPARLQASIVGRNELNFRVRNGNGWTLILINTNYLLSLRESWQRKLIRFRLRCLSTGIILSHLLRFVKHFFKLFSNLKKW